MTLNNKKLDVALDMTKAISVRQKLNIVKDKEHLSIQKISHLTKVSYDIVRHFLDGKKINHIDYQKILDAFPNLTDDQKNVILALSPIDIFGVITETGFVRHLYINEPKHFYFLDHLKRVFGDHIVAIKNPSGESYNLCKLTYIKDTKDTKYMQDIFKEQNINKEYFIKTEKSCYYGLLQKSDNKLQLVNWLHHTGLDWDDDETVVEAYFMFVSVSSFWLDAIKNQFKPKISKIENLIKDGSLIGYKNL